jgi:hypothetical protein
MSVSCPARAVGNFLCLPAGEAYPDRETVYFRALCLQRDNQYLIRWEVQEIVYLVVYLVSP